MSAIPQTKSETVVIQRPLRVVKQGERKPPRDDKVELLKVRRELLTLANRIDILIKGQD